MKYLLGGLVGLLVGSVTTFIITKKVIMQLADEEIKATEDFYQTVLDAIPDDILETHASEFIGEQQMSDYDEIQDDTDEELIVRSGGSPLISAEPKEEDYPTDEPDIFIRGTNWRFILEQQYSEELEYEKYEFQYFSEDGVTISSDDELVTDTLLTSFQLYPHVYCYGIHDLFGENPFRKDQPAIVTLRNDDMKMDLQILFVTGSSGDL